MKNQTLENLINEYLDQVKKATDLLERIFGTKNILRLWHSKEILQRGRVTDDVSYELHGVGCRVYLSEICVDFDYGPNERVDGFDPWRLYMYACEMPRKYKKYTDKTALEQDFSKYIAQGKAKRLIDSTSNLYFLKP
ncbi:DUF6896 domain-containing protein [Pseudomonas sp. 32A]|jgi:hypothetical protein|uniref:DUF6896 domain-containing protein n=1 Tax=Pseudomonas sp. 32A TaxID=651185 RepID=UPI0040457EF8